MHTYSSLPIVSHLLVQNMNLRSIDLHHHFFPSSLDKAKRNIEIGWRTPDGNLPWNPAISLAGMDVLGIETAILSLPPNPFGTICSENRSVARTHNHFAAQICREHPGRFGFFAGLPFLNDVDGVLEEIAYALDELGADGIALTSSYGEGADAIYVGDDRYDRMWEELNRRHAVVFLHGAQRDSSTPFPHAFLGIPITEVPNETFKAAAHLTVTGKKRKNPDIKIILAHMGGTTPFLAARVAVLSRHMGCLLTHDELLEDFQSFYYETALSAHKATLAAMDKFVAPDRILFGTDFPAVSSEMAAWYSQNLQEYHSDDFERLDGVLRKNALKLLPRLHT